MVTVRATLLRMALLVAGVLVAGCSPGDDGVGPRIDLVAPTAARAGQTLEIAGARFCGDEPIDVLQDGETCAVATSGFITIGDSSASREDVASWTDGRIRVVVPTGAAGATTLVVTANGRVSEPVDFEVLQ